MSLLFNREKKYQFIKLAYIGLSLHEANTLARIVGVAQMRGYMLDEDRKILLTIIDKLERFSGLLETRTQAKQRVLRKYSPGQAEDRLGYFFTKGLGKHLGWKIDWRRTGVLQRRVMKKRAETRPGSSIGKIGRTTVIGHKKLNKDIDDLANALNGMIRSFENIGGAKGAKVGSAFKKKAVSDLLSSIRTSVTIKRK